MSDPVDVLAMSDVDFMNVDVEALVASAESSEAVPIGQEAREPQDAEADTEDGGEQPDPVAQDDADVLDASDDADVSATEDDADDLESDAEDSDELGEEDTSEEPEELSPEAIELASLFEPFQAAGKEVKIDNIADARQLMQMGIGFNKKMQALKPNMKILKMLQKNDILDESKLSFLIDLQNKRPEAIAKLVADSGIDPLDIQTKDLGEYKSNSYNVTDEEVALDDVVESIRDSKHYQTTADIVTNKWDETSQEILVNNPEAIKFIHAHVESGIYDQISKVMDTERMMGRLNGVSDIEAYKQIGNALQAAGTLVGHETQTTPKQQIKAPAAVTPKTDDKLNDRKRAAAPAKGKTPAKQSTADFDPLAMSDEEFEKAMASGLYKLT